MNTKKIIRNWLFLGAVLVFFQVFIGGVTRLTESGLSITEWEVLEGTLPPLNAEDWQKEFEKYKKTPQYKKINEGMSLSEFKSIYFWEYFHRLWARLMGFVFFLPFVTFLFLGWLHKTLIWRLVGIFLSAAVVAVFGWLMVASGLQDRPWVSAYSLSAHLMLALGLLAFILITWASEYWGDKRWVRTGLRSGSVRFLFALICLQIVLGAWMSGMKAGLYMPSWPDFNGESLPSALRSLKNWSWANVVEYDNDTGFMIALVQFLHRNLAYVIVCFVAIWSWKQWWTPEGMWNKFLVRAVPVITLVQVFLGIWTIISCRGKIPVGLGSAHQVVAILLFSVVVLLLFSIGRDRDKQEINV